METMRAPKGNVRQVVLTAVLMGVVMFATAVRIAAPNAADCAAKTCEPGMASTLRDGACMCVRTQPCRGVGCSTDRDPRLVPGFRRPGYGDERTHN